MKTEKDRLDVFIEMACLFAEEEAEPLHCKIRNLEEDKAFLMDIAKKVYDHLKKSEYARAGARLEDTLIHFGEL